MTINTPSVKTIFNLIRSRKRALSVIQIAQRTRLSNYTVRGALAMLASAKLVKQSGQINTGAQGRPAYTYGIA